MSVKHFNHNYSGSDPVSVGDRFYGQDRGRDFFHLKEFDGIVAHILGGSVNAIVLSGLVVTQGAGHTLSWTAGRVLTKRTITVPDSWASLPPTVTTTDIYCVIDIPAVTNQAISGTTNNSATLNYAKIEYTDVTGSARTRVLTSGSYNAEVTPSYTLTTTSVAPTAYQVAIATFTTDGATMAFTNAEARLNMIKTVTTTYTVVPTDKVILATGTFTVNLPAVASSKGLTVTIKNIGVGVITIDGNGAETIDGAATIISAVQYESYMLTCNGSAWFVL
jgi:hypothetical protein